MFGVSALLANVASCDDVTPGGVSGDAGETGLVSAGADHGGEAGAAGSNAAASGSGGADAGGAAGAAPDHGGQTSGGAGSDGAPQLACPGDAPLGGAGGGNSDWSWLDAGAGGTTGASFHRITVGPGMSALAINETGQILVRADGEPSCAAWLLEAASAQPIEVESGGCVTAVDLNDAGTVLAMHDSQPFLWKDGVVTYLAGVTGGTAVGFNNAEQVVLAELPGGPALWEDGNLVLLRSPADEALQPIAINASGQVLARIGTADISLSTWLWEDGQAVELGLARADALSDAGVVVGVNVTAGTLGTWYDGTFTPLDLTNPDGAPLHGPDEYDELVASAINAHSEIVGTFFPNWEEVDATPFYYADGVLHFLGSSGQAYDISDAGEVAGQHSRQTPGSGCLRCEDSGDVTGQNAALWLRECPLACCPP